MAAFTFADFFCGIGGMRLGYESIGGRCVYLMEYNQHALRTYQANFSDFSTLYSESSGFSIQTLPDFDVLLAGVPYLPFTLNDIVSVLQAKQPGAFVIENTKTFVSNNRGRIFHSLLDAIKNVGYTVFWRLVDSQAFVPQHRERLLIVGFREAVDFAWPEIPDTKHPLSEILHCVGDVLPDDCGKYTTKDGLALPKYTLSDTLWERITKKYSDTMFRIFTPDDISSTLTGHYGSSNYRCLMSQGEGKNPRRFTPRECARLMGFPDSFRIPVSDTQAYNVLCSAAIVPMIAWVANGMLPRIMRMVEKNV